MHVGYQRRSTVRFCRQFPRTARLGNWFLVLLGCASRRHLTNAHASFNIAVLAIMGPRYRNQGSNRLTKASQGDGKKIKHNKSLKNKVRDVQRLLKKVRQLEYLNKYILAVICSVFINLFVSCLR